jgi:hypothetical protein
MPENRIWEIISTRDDAATAEMTGTYDRSAGSTLPYVTAPNHSAANERKPLEANRKAFAQNAGLVAAEGTIVTR